MAFGQPTRFDPNCEGQWSWAEVIFRPIEGFEGYGVDSDGVVWSRYIPRKHELGPTWRPLAPAVNAGGYLQVGLTRRPGQRQSLLVHHLVLTAFVGPRPDGMDACHFPDRDPKNNRLSNLRWDTRYGNTADKVAHGTMPTGERVGSSKLSDVDVIAIQELALSGLTGKEIAERFGINKSTVTQIVRGKGWKHLDRPLLHRPKGWRRKLSAEQVMEIREAAGVVSLSEMGRRHGVSTTTIQSVILRETYAEVR